MDYTAKLINYKKHTSKLYYNTSGLEDTHQYVVIPSWRFLCMTVHLLDNIKEVATVSTHGHDGWSCHELKQMKLQLNTNMKLNTF